MDFDQIDELISSKKFWKAQEMLVSLKNTVQDPAQITQITARIDDVFSHIREQAAENQSTAVIKFGTSGWRAVIGEDYTIANVKRVTQAVVNMMKTSEFLREIGVDSFAQVQSRGGLIGYDSRFMGLDFAKAAALVLNANGVKVYFAGMSTTPELSAAVVELQAAFSINLTPSHNPFEYAGYKFNPSDGGPAGPNLTTIIEQNCEAIMAGQTVSQSEHVVWHEVDSIQLYMNFIQRKNPVIRLSELVSAINKTDIFIAIDNVHGATRARIQRLLAGVDPSRLQFLRTEDDYLFGGIKPEPSLANMEQVTRMLNTSTARLKLGAIMDPDGDRVRVTDGQVDVEMNYFGAMALYYLKHFKGLNGCLAKSVATSNFANAVADKLGVPVNETAVGFKEFRPYLKADTPTKAIVAFEESDGITMQDHTLEKDALIGGLLAIQMVIDLDKNLGLIKQDVQDLAGAYYPGRGGMDVDRTLAGAPLLAKLNALNKYKPGVQLSVAQQLKTIKTDITLDGYKFVFEDNSWLLIRPSGTEPKVRFYVEGRTEGEKDQLIDTAKTLLSECL